MKKKLLLIILSLFLSFMTVISATYAWFRVKTSIDLPITGSVFTSYFHCGTGTEEDPYVITRPVHLYNLTMLYQELNGFDEDSIYVQIG